MRTTPGPFAVAVVAVLVMVAGIAVAVAESGDDGAPAAGTTTTPEVVPAANQAFVTGTARRVDVGGTPSIATLPTPLVVTTPAAGPGYGATIEGAVVDGEAVTIVWDAGRPFDLTADGGGLRPGPSHVVLEAGASVVALADDVLLGFVPGTYVLRTPVAVGAAGLGATRDGVTFEAADTTTISFRGGATTAGPQGELALTGPGQVALDGNLEVRTATGTVTASRVELAEGPFELRLVPVPDGTWIVEATLQGEVVAT